ILGHAMYLMGDATVCEVCCYFAWAATALLMPRVCPCVSESMMHAVGAGSGNLNSSVAGTTGSTLLGRVWLAASEGMGTYSFGKMVMLDVVGRFLLLLFALPQCVDFLGYTGVLSRSHTCGV
ncbi:putative BT1 family, partial [Leishmania shawi]